MFHIMVYPSLRLLYLIKCNREGINYLFIYLKHGETLTNFPKLLQIFKAILSYRDYNAHYFTQVYCSEKKVSLFIQFVFMCVCIYIYIEEY